MRNLNIKTATTGQPAIPLCCGFGKVAVRAARPFLLRRFSNPNFTLLLWVFAFPLFMNGQSGPFFTVNDGVLKTNIERERIGSRGTKYRYFFRFVNYPHRFVLEHEYVYYGDWPFTTSSFKPGDTIPIQLNEADREKFNSAQPQTLSVVNIKKQNQWLTDPVKKRKAQQQDNRKLIWLLAGALGTAIVLVGIWLRFRPFTGKSSGEGRADGS